MKKLRKIITIILCLVCLFTFAACGGGKDNTDGDDNDNDNVGTNEPIVLPGPYGDIYAELTEQRTTDVYKSVNYTPEHVSKQYGEYKNDTGRLLTFASSDEGLATFLNSFRERHMRYNDNRVHGHPVGAGQSAWKEWEAMIGCWWDASAQNYTLPAAFATKDLVTSWLLSPAQDKQGYIWADAGSGYSSWGLGWDFPSTKNGHEGKSWRFTNQTLGFTAVNATVSATNGLEVAVSNKNYVELISPDIELSTYVAPFMKFDMNFTGSGSYEMEDMYFYWQTADDDDWDDDRSVAFSDFCLNGYKIGSGNIAQGGYFFPMYLIDDWGWSRDTVITKFKLVLKARGISDFSGKVRFDYITSDYDDRQALNPCNYIIAAKSVCEYAQSSTLLNQILPNARKAMNFMYNQLDGDSGLISTAYFMGHDSGRDKNGNGLGIGDGYWDVLAFPNANLYCNISYYNALVSMAYLESMAQYMNIGQTAVTTVNADMTGNDTYSLDAQSLTELVALCKKRIQTEFWNGYTGRFHCGTFDDGEVLDHGYVMFNEQVVASGIATDKQVKWVMDWINGEREIESDNSTGEDIYFYEFAPRFNTHDIGNDFAYVYHTTWNGNLQNGGTALHMTYYDVVAQSKLSAYQCDDAFTRLKNIQTWYEKVAAAGGEGTNFYREYYKGQKVQIGVDKNGNPVYTNMLQGGKDENDHDQNGLVGVDYEFLEAALLLNAIPDAIFGMTANSNNTLVVAPKMPSTLDWLRMENIVYAGYYCDVTVGRYFARIDSAIPYKNAAIASAKVSLQLLEPTFAYKVLLNGEETNEYTVTGGRVVVNASFGNVSVELVEA